MSHSFVGAVFSPKNVLRAKQMLGMDSASLQTPSLTPYMLLGELLFLCIFTLYSKVNGTQTVISDNTNLAGRQEGLS